LNTLFSSNLLIWFIPLPPLLAFVLILLFTSRSNRTSHTLAIGGAALSFIASMVIFFRAINLLGLAQNPLRSQVNWLQLGSDWLKLGVQVDPLTAVMLFFVAWTVLMIIVYSVGYHNFGQPKGVHDRPGLPPEGAEIIHDGKKEHVASIEPIYARFFALISLFAFAMYLLVVSDNLLMLYIGWEIMGLCSYLLIGFWYAKDSAKKAAVKAFLTTRIGDMFMMLGLAALYSLTGSLSFQETIHNPQVLGILSSTISPVFGLSWAGLIGLLLFIGTVGKSAQFPLHVWLPDAMEGPTPVSAMIHAATMVSAGVYLVARFFPLISAGWEPGQALNPVMTTMAVVGAFTAIFTATIAMAQNDIKRVLAYSTISQLGFMIAALGIGAYVAAVFHLVMHAFFKALLFLGSGSVIHGMEHGKMHSGEAIDPQDMRNMGGLRRKMPVTFWTFLVGGLALSGLPLVTAGFWSKDEILSGAFSGGHLAIFITLAVSALLTAFYTARQITLVFLGEPRTKSAAHAHESKPVMTLPLVVLGVFAVAAGWVGIPHSFPLIGKLSSAWFQTFMGSMVSVEPVEGHSLIPLTVSLLVSLGGLALGWLVYRRKVSAEAKDPLHVALGPAFVVLQNKYYLDEFYGFAIIKPWQWFGEKVVYQFLDKTIIDGFLHGIAAFGVWIGNKLRFWFDLPVINGAGDQLARGTRGFGAVLSKLQTGKVQQYMMITLACLVVTVILLFYFLV
jgi:NADH-quinone oxidoreductase subunit L